MAHGTGGLSAAEPNLTPLLDVVLQLLMFFMMCVNFVTEQVNEDVKLPKSQSARPMMKDGADALLLNLQSFHAEEQARAGKFKPAELAKFREGEPMATALFKPPFKLTELHSFLKQQHEDAARLARGGPVRTVIILRADKDIPYEAVYRVLQMCKGVGYHDLHLRAISKGGPSS